MTQPDWRPLVELKVPAHPEGLWTLAFEFVAGPRKLKFEAEGAWNRAASGTDFGPDGDNSVGLDANALSGLSLVGGLIAKIGGGTADKVDPTASTPVSWVFAVGKRCVYQVTAAQSGSLFLTMNDRPEAFPGHSGEILVKVSEAI